MILWTGAALYARYRLVLISNTLYDWTVAQVGEGASGYVLSEWGVLWQCDNFFWAIKLFLPHCQHTPPLSSHTAKGVGESQFQRLEKRFALCLLCVPNCTPPSISRKCSTVPGKKLNYIMASVAVGIRCMGPLGGKQGFLPSQHSIAYSLGHLFNFSLVLLNFFAISCLPTCLF